MLNKKLALTTLAYLTLGTAGVAGLMAVTTQAEPPAPPPIVVVPTPTASAPFTVVADFDRRLLPFGAPEAFVRVEVTGGEQHGERMPAEVFLVVDRSGSMSGQKIVDAKRAVQEALRSLRAGDTYHLIAFGSEVEHLASGTIPQLWNSPQPALQPALRSLDALVARGGTNMRGALEAIQARVVEAQGRPRVRRVLLVSDGHPDNSSGLTDLSASLAGRGIITTTLGVGLDYNEDLMAQLADSGRGNYHFVERTTDLVGVFAKELRDMASVVARDVIVEFDAEALGMAEALGVSALPYRWGDRGPRVAIGDIYAGRSVELLFRVPLVHAKGEKIAVHVVARAQEEVARAIAHAAFSDDLDKVNASTVALVQEQSARYTASQSWLLANAYYNDSDLENGNRAVDEVLLQLETQAKNLDSDTLRGEAAALRQFRNDNNDEGNSRRSLNNFAKWRAREMNR